jgi:hypothetical protein
MKMKKLLDSRDTLKFSKLSDPIKTKLLKLLNGTFRFKKKQLDDKKEGMKTELDKPTFSKKDFNKLITLAFMDPEEKAYSPELEKQIILAIENNYEFTEENLNYLSFILCRTPKL